MPSTVGLRPVIPRPGARHWFELSPAERAALPADLLAAAGLTADDDIVGEAGPEGLRLTADRLRKVYVEATTCCNLNCATCVRHTWAEPLGHMPLDRYRRLVDGLVPGTTITFGGFGEPLAHPAILELVHLARAQGLAVELITNGLLLNEATIAALLECGAAQITVSVDGGDAAAYAGVRGEGFVAVSAVLTALSLARRRARSAMRIGLAFVATRRNVGSRPGLLRLARAVDANFVAVSNVAPHTPEMAAEALWDTAAWTTGFSAQGWRPRLALPRMDLDDETRPALQAIFGQAATFPPPELAGGAWTGAAATRNHCRFAHEGVLAVAWDGPVAPCLSLLHTHPEHVNGHWKTVHSYAVGHVDERPLLDIWRDVTYRDFRQRLRTFDFAPCFACGDCPEMDTNDTDCYGSPFPSCSECLWAQGIVLCP